MEKLRAAVWNLPRAGLAVSPGNSRDPTTPCFLPVPSQTQLELSRAGCQRPRCAEQEPPARGGEGDWLWDLGDLNLLEVRGAGLSEHPFPYLHTTSCSRSPPLPASLSPNHQFPS